MPQEKNEEVVDKTSFEGVEVELGFTKSLGEGTFEFLRVDIRHRAKLTEGESIDDLTDRIFSNLENTLVEKVNELDMALGPRGRTSQIHDNKR